MTIFKLYYEDKMAEGTPVRVSFALGDDMVDAAGEFLAEHNESKYKLLKIEYVGQAKNPPKTE